MIRARVNWDLVTVGETLVKENFFDLERWRHFILRIPPSQDALQHRWNKQMIEQMDGHMFVESTLFTVEFDLVDSAGRKLTRGQNA